MGALNFQKQFVNAVLNGEKTQTIRKARKYPIKKGETLYLYTGLRTKNTRKLKEVICEAVYHIIITDKLVRFNSDITINTLEWLNIFARADGFKDWKNMIDWFHDTHGLPFKGQLITWDSR